METILECTEVDVAGDAALGGVYRGISFRLRPGGIVCVHADHESEDVPLLELVTGLVVPERGRICFLGRDWIKMHHGEQTVARGQIGSLGADQAWLANQTVLRNVLLRERHHTARPEGELEAEADALAREVGLDRVPRSRPESVPPRQLQMAGLVRAFSGNPVLLVLLFPERGAVANWATALQALLGRAVSSGSAALLVSDSPALWSLPLMAEAQHYGFDEHVWQQREKDEGI